MAEDDQEDLAVKPQQLIGGINGMILQQHKMQVELEEHRNRQKEFIEKIKSLEMKNESLRNETDDLMKAKERLVEQNGFMQKSLNKTKTKNNDLLERLKQAEIQLGESGSVLDSVKNLESKNELLNVKMSSVVINTEEEITKVKTEHEHYLNLLEEASDLNKRNVELQKSLEETEQANKVQFEQAKAMVEKTEKAYREITKSLDEILLAKERYTKFNEEKESLQKELKSSSDAHELLLRENDGLKKKLKDFEMKHGSLGRAFNEQRKSNDLLKEQFTRIKKEKEEADEMIGSLRKKLDENKAASSSQKIQKTKEYTALQEQVKLLAESYGKTTQQLDKLHESVRESKDLLKANIESAPKSEDLSPNTLEEAPAGMEHSQMMQEYLAIVVEMQGFFKHSDIRNEELASLEKMAGISEQRFNEESAGSTTSTGHDASGFSSCIRGLVAMKDSQIDALVKERDDLSREIIEKKKIEYRQLYALNEIHKEKEELLAKIASCQEKHRKIKEEKEEMRKELLVKNASEKIIQNYMNNLKQENEQYKNELRRQEESLNQKYSAMKNDLDQKLKTRDTLIQAMREKVVIFQHERDSMKNELNSRQLKDNAIKEQIISIFGK